MKTGVDPADSVCWEEIGECMSLAPNDLWWTLVIIAALIWLVAS